MPSVPTWSPAPLVGSLVRLDPLTHGHIGSLTAAASEDRSTFAFTPIPDGRDAMARYVDIALAGHAAGHMVPLVTTRLADPTAGDVDRVVGCTRFCRIERWDWPAGSPEHGRRTPDVCEIGYTWLAPSAQRSGVNVEAKLLMMTLAFETWRMHRIAWRTDVRNERSRRGIERIGAAYEGVTRAERIAADGTIRDSVCYSMVAAEWPAAKAALEARLVRKAD